MVSVEEARQQLQQQQQLLEQRRRDAERARLSLSQARQSLPRITQAGLRAGTFAGQNGMQKRKTLQSRKREISQREQEVGEYEKGLQEYEREVLTPYSEQVSQAERAMQEAQTRQQQYEYAVKANLGLVSGGKIGNIPKDIRELAQKQALEIEKGKSIIAKSSALKNIEATLGLKLDQKKIDELLGKTTIPKDFDYSTVKIGGKTIEELRKEFPSADSISGKAIKDFTIPQATIGGKTFEELRREIDLSKGLPELKEIKAEGIEFDPYSVKISGKTFEELRKETKLPKELPPVKISGKTFEEMRKEYPELSEAPSIVPFVKEEFRKLPSKLGEIELPTMGAFVLEEGKPKKYKVKEVLSGAKSFIEKARQTSPLNPQFYLEPTKTTMVSETGDVISSGTTYQPTLTSLFVAGLPYAISATPRAFVSMDLKIPQKIPQTEFLAGPEQVGEGYTKVNYVGTTKYESQNVFFIGKQASKQVGDKPLYLSGAYAIPYKAGLKFPSGKYVFKFDLKNTQKVTDWGFGSQLGKASVAKDLPFFKVSGEVGTGYLTTGLGTGNLVRTASVVKEAGRISLLKGGSPFLRIYKTGKLTYTIPEVAITGLFLKKRTEETGVKILQPANIKKTPLSSTFAQQETLGANIRTIGEEALKQVTKKSFRAPITGAVFRKQKQIPAGLSLVAEPSEQKIGLVSGTSVISIPKQKEKQEQIPLLKTELSLIPLQREKQKQIPALRTELILTSVPKESQLFGISPKLTQGQVQRQRQKQRQRQEETQIQVPRIKIPTPKTPKIPKIPFLEEKKAKKKKREEELVIPFIKRRGAFAPVSEKPLTFFQAFKTGIGKLKTTLGASLQIRGAKTGKPLKIAKETRMFRAGKKGKDPFTIVQKAPFRLGTQQEVSEIISSRRKKWF